jgi:acyl-coenzyme A thioesterase PaaI-like protein
MGNPTVSRWRRLRLKLLANLYGPYLLAGIRLTRVAHDLGTIEVQMALRPWNRNYVGTHFGGSLFSMADPWFMIMLLERLGPGYQVWDKAGAIRFRKAGRGTVRALFTIAPERVEEIRRAADADGKVEPVFTVSIVDGLGEVVAEVEKVISVRRRSRARPLPGRAASTRSR